VHRTAATIILSVALLLAAVGAATADSLRRPATSASAMLDLVPSYLPPAGDPAGDSVAGRGWMYDSALVAAGLAATGRTDGAARIVGQLTALQRPDGALDFSYDLRSGEGDGVLRSGAIGWAGLAGAELRAVTCTHRDDALLEGVARWLLGRRTADGLVTGGPDVTWVSTEHNLETRAFFARLSALIDGRTADSGTGRRCGGGLGDLTPGQARALRARLDDAVTRLDAAIGTDLFARDGGGRAHFRQGLRDDARPLDVQALGIQWLLGQGRRADALAVAAYADDAMLVGGRTIGAVGPLTGYRPYADAWGPDVLWVEGTAMMRAAKRGLGLDTTVIDRTVDSLSRISPAGYLPQADRDVVGNQGGDYRTWDAAAPAGWLVLSRSRSALLR
jgi:hypothetical protein